jgi:hypothetical protein
MSQDEPSDASGPLTGPQPAGGDRPEAPDRPVLRIVRGEPTEAEVAALVTVVAALGTGTGTAAAPPRSQWRNRARNIRPAIGPGPGAWRASGLPR